jgi:hypothetical protein
MLTVVSSCEKEDDEPIDDDTHYENGVFVVNEGNYGSGNGTISFYSRQTKEVSQDIFGTENDGAALGDVVQSMSIYNGKAYIVVNNSSKVEVVESGHFESKGTIEGLTSPRYFVALNSSKAYVSDWGSTGGNVSVVDLSSNTVSATIDVKGTGPENMLITDNKLFVINSGGWGSDSTISVIDTDADTLLSVITVGDNPRGMQLDVNGKLWVLCGGIMDWNNPANDTKGKLVQLDPENYNIEQTFEFSTTDYHPSDLIINDEKNKFYYIYNSGVYEFDITNPAFSSSALISGSFYAIGYDAETDYIYAADPIDYVQSGTVYRYVAANGQLVDSFSAGIIPGDFCFE